MIRVAFVKSFLGAFLHLSALDRYNTSHNYIKTLFGFEVPDRQVRCEADCFSEQLIVLQSRQL